MTTESDRVERQAAQWLVQIESSGTPENWSRLDDWLARHPRHRAAFLRLSIAWRRADDLASLRNAVADCDENFLGRPARAMRVLREKLEPAWLSFAAAMALALLGAGITYLSRHDALVEIYTSGPGEHASFTLTDGSQVVLNANSRLRVRYTPARRELTLVRGEIALNVRPDRGRPFELHTGIGTFKVLGTSFSVRVHENGSVEIAVTEGQVAIESDGILVAGDVARLQGRTVHKRRVSLETLERKLAWTQGRLIFYGETLSEAAAEFNRYNARRLVIADRRLGHLKIFGTFDVSRPEMFAAALEEPFGLKARTVTEDGGKTVIRLGSS